MTQPVTKRADQLDLGDRIPESQLIYKFNKGPAEVVFLADEPEDSHTFIAYRYPNRRHESMTVRSEAVLQVYPESPADDGEVTQPIAGRVPAEVAGGLVEVDPPEGLVPVSARCPSCESPDPRLHPATQAEGEVLGVCPDRFHSSGS